MPLLKPIFLAAGLPFLISCFWCVEAQATDTGKIVSVSRAHCLEFGHAAEKENKAYLMIAECQDGDGQLFSLFPVEAGFFQIVLKTSGECLTAKGNGAEFVSRICDDGEDQQFALRHEPLAQYRLVSRSANMCLTVPDKADDRADGVVDARNCTGTSNQRFRIVGYE